SFFDKNLKWNVPISGKFVDILMRYFHPSSVVDVGCGNAEFLHEFQKRKVLIKGYEGSRHAIDSALVDKEFIELFDLRNAIQDSRKYDLVLCLEVAEHIEKDFSPKLVENVTKLGDTVLFTAAPPGQGGHFHMNEQPREFWIDLFAIRNFSIDEYLATTLKKEMKDKGILSWYCDNLMVFKRR
ncbi:MAG: methyltransferase domain-containing protein, partial [Candidatus Omnitrophica bacterium]|nr:methyltransferase domain-containing protein [Candidatus Omnitrophota bacterium]